MPFKSTSAQSVGQSIGVYKDRDLSLRGDIQSSRYVPPPVPPIEATGGNQTTPAGFTSGDYKYHVFTSSGTFTVTAGGNIEFLVVAGGGGGGWGNGGAGGAGGLRTNDPAVPAPIRISDTVSVSAGPYAITVGGGGDSNTTPYTTNRAGGNSSIASLVVASGGGAGGPAPTASDMDGGSGGGQQGAAAGDSVASPDGLTPTVQGSAGGTRDGGGGGGGASQIDGPIQTSPPYQPAAGMVGLECPAFSSPIINPGCPMPSEWQTYVGANGMYAQGGWGYPGRDSSWNAPSPDYSGRANTGGGADANNSGQGGAGIVIIRYPA